MRCIDDTKHVVGPLATGLVRIEATEKSRPAGNIQVIVPKFFADVPQLVGCEDVIDIGQQGLRFATLVCIGVFEGFEGFQ